MTHRKQSSRSHPWSGAWFCACLVLVAGIARGQDAAKPSDQAKAADVAAPGRAASRALPIDKTLAALEIGSLDRFESEAAALPLLAFFKHPKVLGIWDYSAAQDAESKANLDAMSQLRQWLAAFDAGLTASFVFMPSMWGTRKQPGLFVSGASQAGRSLDAFEAGFLEILNKARKQGHDLEACAITRKPVTDSPLTIGLIEVPTSTEVNSDWGYRKRASLLQKGRSAAFYLASAYGPLDEEKVATYDRGIADTLAELVALRRDPPDLLSFGVAPPLREGETVVARAVLRVDEHLSSKEHGPTGDNVEAEMKASGFLGWDGACASLLHKADGSLREVLDSHDRRVTQASIFRGLRGNGKGLGDRAASVPADALAVLRLVIDDAILTQWMQNMGDAFESRGDIDGFFAGFRATLGLQPADADKGFAGLDEVTVAIVPPAPGVLAPEFCFLLPGRGEAEAPARLLEAVASLLASAGIETEAKTLGKGDDAVPYLTLKTESGGGMMMAGGESMIFKALFGGGFLSAANVGDRLVLGCNPRTVRKFVRDVAAEKTLATRPGFLDKFPKGANHFLEAWFDWKQVVASMRVIDSLAPLGMAFMAGAESAAVVAPGEVVEEPEPIEPEEGKATAAKPKLVLPTTKDISELVGEQFVRGSETAFGHRIDFEGSLVLSPIAFTAFGVVVAELDGFFSYLRTW